MALSEDSAAVAAATLASAVVTTAGVQPGMTRDEAVGHVMDLYRRSLNVVRNASEAPRPRKT